MYCYLLCHFTTPHRLAGVKKTLLLGNASIRGVSGSWVVVAAVVFWSYSGALTSLLAVRFIPQPIQTLRDLLDDSSLIVIMEPNTIVTDTISVGFPHLTLCLPVALGILITDTRYTKSPVCCNSRFVTLFVENGFWRASRAPRAAICWPRALSTRLHLPPRP